VNNPLFDQEKRNGVKMSPFLSQPPDPLEEIRQEHEIFLGELEALAVVAISTGDWSQVRNLINDFNNYQDDHTN
jgi:hypothetical protein